MQSRVIEIGGCEIMVERLGAGTPIVVLHGEGGPRGSRDFIAMLAESFEVHVPRLAGWADTKRAAHVVSVRDLALVVQEYIEGLDGPVSIVGLSIGGWVAAELAAAAPALVSRMVLVSPIGVKIGGCEDRDFADLYMLADHDRQDIYYGAERRSDAAFADNGTCRGDGIDIHLERALADDATVRYCWNPYMHDPTLKGRLPRVRASTLVVSGGADRFVLNADYYDGYADLIVGARHETFDDVGHRVEEEAADALAARVCAFLAASSRVPEARAIA